MSLRFPCRKTLSILLNVVFFSYVFYTNITYSGLKIVQLFVLYKGPTRVLRAGLLKPATLNFFFLHSYMLLNRNYVCMYVGMWYTSLNYVDTRLQILWLITKLYFGHFTGLSEYLVIYWRLAVDIIRFCPVGQSFKVIVELTYSICNILIGTVIYKDVHQQRTYGMHEARTDGRPLKCLKLICK